MTHFPQLIAMQLRLICRLISSFIDFTESACDDNKKYPFFVAYFPKRSEYFATVVAEVLSVFM